MISKSENTTDTNIVAWSSDSEAHGGRKSLPAAVSDAIGTQTHDRPPDLMMKIGKTTYRVWAHFSQTSEETLDEKIKRMLCDDVRRAMQMDV